MRSKGNINKLTRVNPICQYMQAPVEKPQQTRAQNELNEKLQMNDHLGSKVLRLTETQMVSPSELDLVPRLVRSLATRRVNLMASHLVEGWVLN